MTISLEEVEHVARLARIGLSDDERVRLAQQLGDILDYARRVSEVDTGSVEPMAHAIRLRNVLREDVPGPSLTQEQALSAAPASEAGGFLVPRII
jgi:aspartyl-tRNA(Asn)/glutamyl-tRNA(Gln) amidotransferase subunit C